MSHDDYDRYLDDFGARLERAAAQAPVPARRRWAFGAGGTLAVAGAAAVIILAVGGGAPGGRLDAVAEARAALSPRGKIVHLVLSPAFQIGGSKLTSGPRMETWTAVSPPRWRLRQTLPRGVSMSRRGRLVAVRGVQEFSYGHGSQRTYTAQFDELLVQRGFTDRGPAARPPTLLQLGGRDPADVLRSMLGQGRLRDSGERTVRGRKVRRLVGESRVDARSTRTLTYDVDPDTFAPVAGSLTNRTRISPGHTQKSVFSFVVTRYAVFPDTARYAHLLKPPTTAKTKVIIRSAAALRRDQARMRAAAKKCRPTKGGNTRCPVSVIRAADAPTAPRSASTRARARSGRGGSRGG